MRRYHYDQAAGTIAPGAAAPAPASGQPQPGQPEAKPRPSLASAARRAGHRSRRQLMPWLLAVPLPVAAVVTHETVAHHTGLYAGLVLAACAAASVLFTRKWRPSAILAAAALWFTW